jgi:hypothetical protein
MVIVASNLVGYSNLPSVEPAERYDRVGAVVVCFLVKSHMPISVSSVASAPVTLLCVVQCFRSWCQIGRRRFGARSMRGVSVLSEPGQFLSVFLLRLI